MYSLVLLVFKPEPVTVSDSRELVDDDRPKERTRTVRSRLEYSSRPDVDVIDVAVVEIAEVREDLEERLPIILLCAVRRSLTFSKST